MESMHAVPLHLRSPAHEPLLYAAVIVPLATLCVYMVVY
jgi:hypothetical protein